MNCATGISTRESESQAAKKNFMVYGAVIIIKGAVIQKRSSMRGN
jgi:hypothetical protein